MCYNISSFNVYFRENRKVERTNIEEFFHVTVIKVATGLADERWSLKFVSVRVMRRLTGQLYKYIPST